MTISRKRIKVSILSSVSKETTATLDLEDKIET